MVLSLSFHLTISRPPPQNVRKILYVIMSYDNPLVSCRLSTNYPLIFVKQYLTGSQENRDTSAHQSNFNFCKAKYDIPAQTLIKRNVGKEEIVYFVEQIKNLAKNTISNI